MRKAVGIAVLTGSLAAAPTAGAADLTVTGTCFTAGQRLAISGSAFTPNTPVTITGDATGAAQAAADGTFTTEIVAPSSPRLAPRTATIVAIDHINLNNNAQLQLLVVRRAFDSNFPLAGRPDQRTNWRFAGFVPQRPIYGHFRLRGRTVATYRFGVARGRCGTLTRRAPRIPVKNVRPGNWRLKLDQRRTYRASTPGSVVTFRIVARGNT